MEHQNSAVVRKGLFKVRDLLGLCSCESKGILNQGLKIKKKLSNFWNFKSAVSKIYSISL